MNYMDLNMGISTDKLLRVAAICLFTDNNHNGTTARKINTKEIQIPLKEYALLCGCKIEPEPKATPEEQVKENKRAKNALKEFRKKIRKDLEVLYNLTASIKKEKSTGFRHCRFIQEKAIENGYIKIKFSDDFIEYLIKKPIARYPVSLLKVSEKNYNAYKLGLKLAEHYKRTYNKLKVETLLNYTTLPKYEKLGKHSWRIRIKEPFEKALDELYQSGVLENWEYVGAKGKKLSDEEADFSSYAEWVETYIAFKIKK